MNQERVQTRDVARLVVPRCGQLVSTGDPGAPYRLIDADGTVVKPVTAFLRELLAAGRSPSTLRSYGMDLLRWWRFLGARRRLAPRDPIGSARFQLLASAGGQTPAKLVARPSGCNSRVGWPAESRNRQGRPWSRVFAGDDCSQRDGATWLLRLQRDLGAGPIVNPFPLNIAHAGRRGRMPTTIRWTPGSTTA